jgi:hypothetical protein
LKYTPRPKQNKASKRKKKQGKANFLGRTAFTEVNVRSGSYSEDIVKELEIGKEKRGK